MELRRRLPLLALSVGLFSTSALADAPNEDESPPTVTITSPADQATFTGAPAMVTVTVTAEDPDTGVDEVALSLDGADEPTKSTAPYSWELELAEGMHEISVTATNGHGYRSAATIIHVVVFPDGGGSSGGAESSGGGSDSEGSAGSAGGSAGGSTATAGDEGGGDDDDKGGCSTGRPRGLLGSGIAFTVAFVAGIALRRRDR